MNVSVFCGAHQGFDPRHREQAVGLAHAMARHGAHLIYGGASIGLMGVLADACLAAGSTVRGVIPRHLLEAEVAHEGLTHLDVVADMAERKRLLLDLADAFVVLPGGLGTFDELFEVLTLKQLGLLDKPVALLDTDGYFAPLVALLDSARVAGFVGSRTDQLIAEVSCDPDLVVTALAKDIARDD